MGVNGMVTSAHPLSSLAGAQVLQDGGNAVDAAIAVATTLGIVEPYMSGAGGIGMALVYMAREGRVRALNFSGRAPRAADTARFTDDTKETGILAPLIPGNVAGWMELHRTYGSLDRERLFRPAVGYARNGFPITHINSLVIHQSAARLRRFPTSAAFMLEAGGKPPAAGVKFRMPQAADTLEKIARHGPDIFYKGEIAEKLARFSKEMNGLITAQDLADYRVEWQEPIAIDYRGYRVHVTPPNSTGFQILQTLKVIEGFSGADITHHGIESVHILMEAVKLCVTDRIKWGGDPDYTKIPVKAVLSDGYAARQRRRIDRSAAASVMGERFALNRPMGALTPGSPEEFDGGMTTHFAVADRDGNVVSVTQTLGGYFGSGVVVGDTGLFLNNMCSYFDLEEGSSNRIGPWKRVDFVISPTQTFKDGKFFLSMGTPGGWGIPQTTSQLLMNVLDHGMNVQQAVEAPRFRYYRDRYVEMEERFPLNLRQSLEMKGHKVGIVEAWSRSVGGAHAIQVDAASGTFHGGADPRRDGVAIGL